MSLLDATIYLFIDFITIYNQQVKYKMAVTTHYLRLVQCISISASPNFFVFESASDGISNTLSLNCYKTGFNTTLRCDLINGSFFTLSASSEDNSIEIRSLVENAFM